MTDTTGDATNPTRLEPPVPSPKRAVAKGGRIGTTQWGRILVASQAGRAVVSGRNRLRQSVRSCKTHDGRRHERTNRTGSIMKTNIMSRRWANIVAAGVVTLGATAMTAMPAAAASAASGGTEHFTFVTAGADPANRPGPIIATGAFNAVGTDYQGDAVDRVVFPHGTFKLDHSQPGGTINFSFNPITCIETLHGNSLPFTITDGTGAFTGISGSGTSNITVVAVRGRNRDGSCTVITHDGTGTTDTGYLVVKATAIVSFDG